MLPVDVVALRVAHGGEEHPSGLRLGGDVVHGAFGPHGASGIHLGPAGDGKGPGGAQKRAALAVHALHGIGAQGASFLVAVVHLVGALAHAQVAVDAFFPVAQYFVAGVAEVAHGLGLLPAGQHADLVGQRRVVRIVLGVGIGSSLGGDHGIKLHHKGLAAPDGAHVLRVGAH